MNVIWTETEYKQLRELNKGYLDYGTTMATQSVCEVQYTF